MANNCEPCALRLFNEKCYNISGIGNPFSGNMIIISNMDSKAYKNRDLDFSEQVRLLKETIISSKGVDILLESFYVTPLIKCQEYGCVADDNSVGCCLNNLADEFTKYHPINVMVTGSAVNRFLGCDITEYLDKAIISKNRIRYCVNYSPLVKFKDDNKFEVFKNHLNKWISSIEYRNFDNYETVIV